MNDIRKLVLASLALLLPVVAAAQTTFYEAYAEGLEHEQAGRWEQAGEAFATAARLHPEPERRIKTYGLNFLHGYDPYLHLARADLRLGRLERAGQELARSEAAGVSSPAEVALLRTELARLLHREQTAAAAPAATAVPTIAATATATPPTVLVIRSSPTGADVFLDGRLVGVTPVRLPVASGRRRIELRVDGYLPIRDVVAVPEFEEVERRLILQPLPPPTTAPTDRPTRAPTATRPPLVQAAVVSSQATEIPPTVTVVPPTPTSAVPKTEGVPTAAAGSRRRWLTAAAIAAAVLLAAILWFVRRRKKNGPPRRQPSAYTLTPTRLLVGSYTAPPTATPLPETMPPEFGSYRLQMVLGHGGMATTYLAERKRDGAAVAVKIPHEHLLQDPEFVERFVREGSLGATIHHPNIIRIHEAGRTKDKPFIAMEFLEGITLEQRLAEGGAMPVREALEVARGIALALDYAHMKGTIHRDLKPENVMILNSGTIKVMDFGIARVVDAPGLTATNTYLGTPLYSAPECLNSSEIDQRSDLYTLGIVMYRMLTNRLPFESSSPLRLFELHRDQPLPPFPRELAIPQAVITMVLRLTAKSKEDRYPSAEVMLRDMNMILNDL